MPSSKKVGISICNWTVAVRRLDLNDSALRPALLALSLVQIGESSNDRAVSEQAIKLYGTTLKEINLALQNQDRLQTDKLSTAGKLTVGYEVFKSRRSVPVTRSVLTGRAGSTWDQLAEPYRWYHQAFGDQGASPACHSGCAHTFPRHSSYSGNSQFPTHRTRDTNGLQILAAIVSRKPNFFATPLWQTLTFDGREKDLSDASFDLWQLSHFCCKILISIERAAIQPWSVSEASSYGTPVVLWTGVYDNGTRA